MNRHDPQPLAVGHLVGLSAAEVERALILATLEATQGNRTRAAGILKISLRTLRNKLALYRLSGAVADDPDSGTANTTPWEVRP